MLQDFNAEAKIEHQEKRFKELSVQLENFEKDFLNLTESLPLSNEEITAFIETKENFSEEIWEALQHQKKLFEEKLERSLSNIRNPLKTKKSLESLNTRPHWIFVR